MTRKDFDGAIFEHDCDRCRYLGTLTEPCVCDLYICGDSTTLARTGNDPSDYASWTLDLDELPWYAQLIKELIRDNRYIHPRENYITYYLYRMHTKGYERFLLELI